MRAGVVAGVLTSAMAALCVAAVTLAAPPVAAAVAHPATRSLTAATPAKVPPAGTETATETYADGTGKVAESEQITLDSGYDVPQLNALDPEHRLDLKWTITVSFQCVNLGTDPCPTQAALGTPNLTCVDGNGKPDSVCGGPGWDFGGTPDDKALGCKSYPTEFVALPSGVPVSICTSSTLSPWESGSIASYSLGIAPGTLDTADSTVTFPLTDPWDAQTEKPAPVKYRSWPCSAKGAGWAGRVPPACISNPEDSGAFRRVYSDPGFFGATAVVRLPKAQSDVPLHPYGLPGLQKQASDIYFSVWSGTGDKAAQWEFGLEYEQQANDYAVYARGPGIGTWWNPTGADKGIRLDAGDTVRLTVSANPAGYKVGPGWPTVTGCAKGKDCLVYQIQDTRLGKARDYVFSTQGIKGNKLTFARMTTIAQTMAPKHEGNVFNDGADFGPVAWSAARLAKITRSGVTAEDWVGGTQNWPDDPTRVLVTGREGLTAETDTLYLIP